MIEEGPVNMSAEPAMHPWVARYQDRLGWGLQTFARPDDPQPGQRVVAAGLLAEELGLDGFFIGDHPARNNDPWPHLAAIAVQTQRVTLGSVVLCALYRNPVVTARLASDLDHLSDG